MDWLNDPNAWVGLLTLTVLEIVLGIDNIIFISILAGKLPKAKQARARRVGLLGAFGTRLILLMSIAWIVRLTQPLFSVFATRCRDAISSCCSAAFSHREGDVRDPQTSSREKTRPDASKRAKASFGAVITQIMLIDIVFSLDSVITACGMAEHVSVMITDERHRPRDHAHRSWTNKLSSIGTRRSRCWRWRSCC